MKPQEFTITRRLIQLESVRHAMLPGEIGYVSLAQFGDTAVEEVGRALDDLGSQGMKGLILDLRNNPGGYLQAAVKLVDNFVSDTDVPIVTQKSPSGRFSLPWKISNFSISAGRLSRTARGRKPSISTGMVVWPR